MRTPCSAHIYKENWIPLYRHIAIFLNRFLSCASLAFYLSDSFWQGTKLSIKERVLIKIYVYKRTLIWLVTLRTVFLVVSCLVGHSSSPLKGLRVNRRRHVGSSSHPVFSDCVRGGPCVACDAGKGCWLEGPGVPGNREWAGRRVDLCSTV